jgi:hypothetical protein
MAIQVACDSCGAEFSVADAHAGKRIKCKSCGEPVRVPLDDEPVAAAPTRSARTGKGKKRKGGGKKSSPLPLIIGGVGAGVLVLGVVAVVLVSRGSRSTLPADPASAAPGIAATLGEGRGTAGSDSQAEAELAAVMKEVRQIQAEMLPVYRSIKTVADVSTAKPKLLSIGERLMAKERRALEIQASGRVPPAAVERQRAEDRAARRIMGPELTDALNAIVTNRELVQTFAEVSRALMNQRMEFNKSLPPELAAVLTRTSGNPEFENLAKLLPQGLNAPEIGMNVRGFAREHGDEHSAAIIIVSSVPEIGTACGERIREITGNKFVSVKTTPVTVEGVQRSATVTYPTSLESRQEVLDAIDFGEIVGREDALSVYVVQARDDYRFMPGQGPVVKNPDFVWDGYHPSSFHLRNAADVAIVVRLEGVDWAQHPGLGKRVIKSILELDEFAIDESGQKNHTYLVFRGPANLDEFVQQAAKAGTVLRTVPERRVVILQVNPARFPGP